MFDSSKFPISSLNEIRPIQVPVEYRPEKDVIVEGKMKKEEETVNLKGAE